MHSSSKKTKVASYRKYFLTVCGPQRTLRKQKFPPNSPVIYLQIPLLITLPLLQRHTIPNRKAKLCYQQNYNISRIGALIFFLKLLRATLSQPMQVNMYLFSFPASFSKFKCFNKMKSMESQKTVKRSFNPIDC